MKLSTYNDELHLRSASLADGVISDYGRIFDQDGRPPCYVQAMAADTNGLICLVGRFVLKEGEEGATEYEEKDGQGRYIKGAFYKKNYGLFFAVGRVPQQAGESIASDLVK
jgi:hypothetical protein